MHGLVATCREIAQEDMVLKRKFLGRMDRVDKEHNVTMGTLCANLAKSTEAITAGFGMLQALLPPQAPQAQYPYMHQRQFQQFPLSTGYHARTAPSYPAPISVASGTIPHQSSTPFPSRHVLETDVQATTA